MKYGGKEMLEALYADSMIDPSHNLDGCDITLGIDTSGMEKTASKYYYSYSLEVSKTMSEEEQQAVRDNNEKIRERRDAAAEKIANRFASFKRDFIGAPIWWSLTN